MYLALYKRAENIVYIQYAFTSWYVWNLLKWQKAWSSMFYLLFSPGDNHLQVILLKITEGYFLPVSWVSCYLIGPINSRPCEGCWNLKICSSTRPIKEYVLISTGLPYRSLKMSCEKWERLRELSKEMIYASFFHFICNVGYFMGICYQYFNDRHTIWGWLVDVQLKVNVYFEGRNGIYVCYSYLKTIWCQILKIWSWLYWSPIVKTIITTNLTVNGSSASSTFLWLYYLYIMSTLFQKLSSSLFFLKKIWVLELTISILRKSFFMFLPVQLEILNSASCIYSVLGGAEEYLVNCLFE